METPELKAKLYPKHSLPLPQPKRGQIKIKIFMGFVKSLALMVGGIARKPKENGGFLSSNSQTPAETPSGYCSDAQSDRS